MRPIQYTTDELTRAFDGRKVLTLEQLKTALGTPVKMTALRKLHQLDYHSSYSHGDRDKASVFRNTATSGVVDASTFAARVDYTAGSFSTDLEIADLDGDGRPDLAVANFSANTVSLLRN